MTVDSSNDQPRERTEPSLLRRALWIGTGVAVVVLIAFGFNAGRGEKAKEAQREAPVAAPSRLQQVRTPTGDVAAIVLDAATARRIDLRTLVLGDPTSRPGDIRLTGELMADPARISTIRAPVPGRVAAVGGRWPVLGEGLAAGRAVAKVSDARPLDVPRSGVVTRISAQPGELVQAGQELLQVTDFRDPLARIVWRLDLPTVPPPTLTIAPLGAMGPGALGRYVGPAAEADTVTRAPVFLYRVSAAWPGARPGLPVVATLTDPRSAVSGVFVPTAAVVQWEGLAWVYVQRTAPASRGAAAGLQYVRIRIDPTHPIAGGWLVPVLVGGVQPRDTVVVRGAQQLLSEEFRARIQLGG